MTRIQAQEAKAKFAEYIERVSKGETIIITKHGKPTAVLQGFADYHANQHHLSAWESLRERDGLLENGLVETLFTRSQDSAKARIDPEDWL